MTKKYSPALLIQSDQVLWNEFRGKKVYSIKNGTILKIVDGKLTELQIPKELLTDEFAVKK